MRRTLHFLPSANLSACKAGLSVELSRHLLGEARYPLAGQDGRTADHGPKSGVTAVQSSGVDIKVWSETAERDSSSTVSAWFKCIAYGEWELYGLCRGNAS